MYENIGPKIRELRIRKGVSLNDFAKDLEISSGYLSELETGKAKSIKFSTLEKIQMELHVFPEGTNSAFSERLNRLELQLITLDIQDSLYVEHLLHQMESSIDWFLKHQKKSSE